MSDWNKKIEDLQERIRSRDYHTAKAYDILPQGYTYPDLLSAYDIFNSNGVSRNLKENIAKVRCGYCDPAIVEARYEAATRIARSPKIQNDVDRALSGHLVLVLNLAKEVLQNAEAESAYAKWLERKTSKKETPRPEKEEFDFGDWEKPRKNEKQKNERPQPTPENERTFALEVKRLLMPIQERLKKYNRNQLIRFAALVTLTVIVTILFLNWRFAPPPPIVLTVEPEIEQKINAEMEKLFKRCVDEKGKDKRYTKYGEKIYEIANLFWAIIPESVSAEDREFNNVRFRGKIRLVRNPERRDLAIVYRVFDPKTKRYSEKHEPLSFNGDNCPPLSCLFSVSEEDGVLKISSGYRSLVTRCDSPETPAKPLVDDYLTTDQLADYRMNEDGEIEAIKKKIEERFRGECNSKYYIGDYISAEGEEETAKGCFVEATDWQWELSEVESSKTVKKLLVTATGLTEYCKTEENASYIRSGSSRESISDSVTIKFQDGHWRQPEGGTWTVFSCKDAAKVFKQIEIKQREAEAAEKAAQDAERRADEERERIEEQLIAGANKLADKFFQDKFPLCYTPIVIRVLINGSMYSYTIPRRPNKVEMRDVKIVDGVYSGSAVIPFYYSTNSRTGKPGNGEVKVTMTGKVGALKMTGDNEIMGTSNCL